MSRVSSPAGLFNDDTTRAERVVIRTATTDETVVLDRETYVNRTLVMDGIVASGILQFNLWAAKGTGDTFKYFNNAVQTQSVIVAALGADVMSGVAIGFSQTVGESGDLFLTTATSDKITMNVTTTGGLRGDYIELTDISSGTWLVRMHFSGAGTLDTPFSET